MLPVAFFSSGMGVAPSSRLTFLVTDGVKSPAEAMREEGFILMFFTLCVCVCLCVTVCLLYVVCVNTSSSVCREVCTSGVSLPHHLILGSEFSFRILDWLPSKLQGPACL